jgi:holo-[acyl-carrier protein] synthase
VARLLKEKKIKSCHLSISDEKNIAAAFVVLESE